MLEYYDPSLELRFSRTRQIYLTMNETKLNEAEIQVLASLHKAESENTPSNRVALEESGKRFWLFQEDWTNSYPSLVEKGLIESDDNNYRLSQSGRSLGEKYNTERPDMYWYYYRKFYPAARASRAHSRLCERVFGLDLTQEGQADMPALHHLLQLLNIMPGESVLDLGCGAGAIAEYISEKFGVEVTGLDYAVPAIKEAQQRTAQKDGKLTFIHGDMNELELPEKSFDVVVSLDTLYWVADLKKTITEIMKLLKPGGRIGIFMMSDVEEGCTADEIKAGATWLGETLAELGIDYNAYDYTTQHAAFWERNYKAAMDLKDEFESEGNGFIAASLIRESEEEFLPAIESGTVVRYLYHIHL